MRGGASRSNFFIVAWSNCIFFLLLLLLPRQHERVQWPSGAANNYKIMCYITIYDITLSSSSRTLTQNFILHQLLSDTKKAQQMKLPKKFAGLLVSHLPISRHNSFGHQTLFNQLELHREQATLLHVLKNNWQKSMHNAFEHFVSRALVVYSRVPNNHTTSNRFIKHAKKDNLTLLNQLLGF